MTRTHSATGTVAVIGLGYIGLPLAVTLAAAGYLVYGIDTDPAVLRAVHDKKPLLHEPGLAEALAALPGGRLIPADALPGEPLQAIVICVGTAVDPRTKQPDLGHLMAAARHAGEHMDDETLVIVRSTVPVGACRTRVLPPLAARMAHPLLAFCPERTIQGTAMREIRTLPQIIGGIDGRSLRRAGDVLAPVSPDQVLVSSLEAAEMVKLICNAHTDLIYGFGNEVAMLAERLGLDAGELIASANMRYPRPDLSRPGFVGGSCLVKDPYLLLAAGRSAGYDAPIVAASRAVNESLPRHAVSRLLGALAQRDTPIEQTRVLVCGIAYKGRPETDDVRGAASIEVAAALHHQVCALLGHDFAVGNDTICALGFQPVGLDEGLRDADALVVLTDHPRYAGLDAERILPLMAKRPVVFDMWGVAEPGLSDHGELTYLRLGRG